MGGTQETRSQSDEQSAFLLSITLVTPIHGQQPGKRLHRRNRPDARGEYTKLVLRNTNFQLKSLKNSRLHIS